ncbi:MAG TPA: hypothetical protein VMD02_03060 [Candidatus Omnitrophota bacterium]|nr:hypothetical protein [Candidatus Omnitrophota bacterium]
MRRFKLLIALYILLISLSGAVAFADESMTRSEAIDLLSKSQQVKKKENQMMNWGVGYDITKINRVRLMPVINWIKAVPKKIPPDGRTIIEVSAMVQDPGGPKDISGVKADLSGLGRLANAIMVDNGLWGDQIAGDGVFTLQTTVNPDIQMGDKEIPVTAANKKGWIAISKTSLDVETNPELLSATSTPDKASAGSYVVLTVRVDNPGRIEDISEVSVDLRDIGGDKVKLPFVKDDFFSQNVMIGTSVPSGVKRLPVKIVNLAGGETSGIIELEVQ